MSERKRLAGIFPKIKTSIRCGVYRCGQAAEYELRHVQGIIGPDLHFPLCRDCAEDIVRNLPQELRELVAAPPKELTAVELAESLIASEEMKAFVETGSLTPALQQALNQLMDAIEGPEDDAPPPTPEEQKELLDAVSEVPSTAATTANPFLPKNLGKEEKPVYTCAVCGKSFSSENALRGHMLSHRGGKKK